MNLCTWKKLAVMALAACLLCCVLAGASADEKTEGDFTFSIPYGNYATLTGYTGEGGEIAIPEYVDGVPVAGVSSSAFSAVKEKITDVTVPGTMERISSAFKGCVNLTNVTLMNGLTAIGADAFNGCAALTEVNIPDSVTTIGAGAFAGCSSLADVTVPAGVTAIGAGAFDGCDALASITLPAGLEKATGNDWSALPSLTAVVFKGTADQWATVAGQLTLPEGMEVFCTDATAKAAAAPAAATGECAHQWNESADTATCAQPGRIVSTCALCGATKVRLTQALAHDFQPQFEKHGYLTLICVRCGLKVTNKQISGLQWPLQEGDEPSLCDQRGYHITRWRASTVDCGRAGMSDRVICATCGVELVPGYEMPARNHWWGDWQVVCTGNCVMGGLKMRVCNYCKEEQYKETGPNYAYHGPCVLENKVDATCTKYGYSGDLRCTRCGMIAQRGYLLPLNPNNHTGGTTEKDGKKICNSCKKEVVAK